MADNEQGTAPPSAVRRYGPLALGVLAAQIAVTWVLLEFVLAPAWRGDDDEAVAPRPAQAQLPGAAAAEERRLPFYYSPEAFQRILVNPAHTNARRYLVASVQLGLKAYDRTKQPPKDDVTGRMHKEDEVLAILDRYASKMRSIMSDVLARRGVDEYDRRELIPVQEEIRDRINREVLTPAFAGKSRREVRVVEVLFTEMVMQ